jgi:hypothetical protein
LELFVLALSRLVPLLLLVSLTLAGSRYVHDLVLERRPRAARWAFAAVSFVGLLASAPYAWRAVLVVGARWASQSGRWQLADLLHTEYDSWNGSRGERIIRQWAFARMGEGNWTGAEEVLALGDRSPQNVVLTGLCQYYLHDPRAEQTLASVGNQSNTQLCVRDYLLGRIAQQRGDLGAAFALYARSVRWEPGFFPATFHGVRLALVAGRPAQAAAILDEFVKAFPASAADPNIRLLHDCITQGRIPPDEEFHVVSH